MNSQPDTCQGGLDLALRPASNSDSSLILSWRNDASTVATTLSRRSVKIDEHGPWFASKLDDPLCEMFIILGAEGPVGMVRVDYDENEGLISIVIGPEHRGKGIATAALRLVRTQLASYADRPALGAEILASNTASLRAFRSAGFRTVANDGSVVHMTEIHSDQVR